MATRGGSRPGSGRKAKEINEIRRSFAAEILTPTIEKNRFRKMLDSSDERVALDALKYLADQKYGKAPQAMELSGEGGGPLKVEVTDARAKLRAKLASR